jgi:type I restriction enzyme S subunit
VESGYTRFAEGDILPPKITPTFEADRTAIARDLKGGFGCGTTELHVLRPRGGCDVRYARFILSSKPFLTGGQGSMIGVAGQKRVPESFILNFEVEIPPLSLQRRIADFLDAETRRIDSLVSLRQESLARLDLRVRSIVTETLPGSRGTPHERWPWLQTTEEARIVRLGRIAQVQSGLTMDASRTTGDAGVARPYLRVANVQDGYLDLDDVRETVVPASVAAGSELQAGDVLMTEGGDLDKLGRGTVWGGQVPGCLHQNHVFAVRPNLDVLDPQYLALLTTTHHGRAYFESTGARTTNLASTSSIKIADFPIPLLPPNRQRSLVTEIAAKLEHVNRISDATRRQIGLLRERRQALITAAVTGQIDVTRGAA